MKKMCLAKINWVDSHSGRGWQNVDHIREDTVPLPCRSVGWIIEENKNCIVIVPHISSNETEGTIIQELGDLTIPKKAISKITILHG